MNKAIMAGFVVIIFLISISSITFAADDIIIPPTGIYSQPEFKDLSETLGLVISYKPLTPAEPLGILGFDLGIEVTAVDVDQGESFLTEVISDPPSYFVFPKLHAQKGLPFGIDVGVVYAKVPDSNIELIGGEIKWAVLKGSVATPAVALRGSYTSLLGVDTLDLSTYGFDISASKGLGFLTPYIGIGQVWIQSSANVPPPFTLSDENLSRTKGFAGLKLKLLLLSFVGEVEFSQVLSYTLRANLSF
jgi:hypothetical protein